MIQDLEMEMILDYLAGPHVITRGKRGKQEGVREGHMAREAEVGETGLLAWKMEGTRSQRIQTDARS